MSCAQCNYYASELQCRLHGSLADLERWLRCDDYLDKDAEYRGKVGGGCGIYNYPWPEPISLQDGAPRSQADARNQG